MQLSSLPRPLLDSQRLEAISFEALVDGVDVVIDALAGLASLEEAFDEDGFGAGEEEHGFGGANLKLALKKQKQKLNYTIRSNSTP